MRFIIQNQRLQQVDKSTVGPQSKAISAKKRVGPLFCFDALAKACGSVEAGNMPVKRDPSPTDPVFSPLHEFVKSPLKTGLRLWNPDLFLNHPLR